MAISSYQLNSKPSTGSDKSVNRALLSLGAMKKSIFLIFMGLLLIISDYEVSTCEENEYRSQCVSRCRQVCENIYDYGHDDDECGYDCMDPGCVCADGFILEEEGGACISRADCFSLLGY